ncbi:MAG: UbiA prenyltransferase family protein [Bacilli bacterium]
MKKIKIYLKLLRVKHYIKNILLFMPLIFSNLITTKNILLTIIGFISFSFMASTIYIINDIKDIESDKLHKYKKNRPLASGEITKKEAYIIAIILFTASIVLNYFIGGLNSLSYIYLLGYFILNLLYTYIFKKIVVLDIFCLMLFYVIRVYYAAAIINVEVSVWLYLTVMSFSLYIALNKRKGEYISSHHTRKVLSSYNESFLNDFMNICIASTIVFYSLWACNIKGGYFIITIPLLIAIIMKFSLASNNNNNQDVIETLISDKVLIILCLIYGIIVLLLMR